MVKVIIDTCTYAKIIKRSGGINIIGNIIGDKKLKVMNFEIVGNEIGKYSKKALNVYNIIIKNREIIKNSKQISKIAYQYYNEYKKNKGKYAFGKNKNKILKDFKIVACASINNYNIIYSEDKRTMKSKKAINAYEKVNQNHKYRTPDFQSYEDLEKDYKYSKRSQ